MRIFGKALSEFSDSDLKCYRECGKARPSEWLWGVLGSDLARECDAILKARKAAQYMAAYGTGPAKIAEITGVSDSDAKKLVDKYAETYKLDNLFGINQGWIAFDEFKILQEHLFKPEDKFRKGYWNGKLISEMDYSHIVNCIKLIHNRSINNSKYQQKSMGKLMELKQALTENVSMKPNPIHRHTEIPLNDQDFINILKSRGIKPPKSFGVYKDGKKIENVSIQFDETLYPKIQEKTDEIKTTHKRAKKSRRSR